MNKVNTPSLRLAYARIQDVLWRQAQMADHLDSKGATFWAVATATIGIGVPFILSVNPNETPGFLHLLWLIPALAYLISTVTFAVAYFPSHVFELMDNPGRLRDSFWRLDPNEFTYEMALHIETAFKSNDTALERKGLLVRITAGATLVEVIGMTLVAIGIVTV